MEQRATEVVRSEGAGVALDDLSRWLEHLLGQWRSWAAAREDDWLALQTGNAEFPTFAAMLMHAFTPLHRYGDRVLGEPPIDAPKPVEGWTWDFISEWAGRCIHRHRQAIARLDPADAGRLVRFETQSMGLVQIRADRMLAHAATHAAWHLGGLVHLLRKSGVEPPQRNDLLYWGVDQEERPDG